MTVKQAVRNNKAISIILSTIAGGLLAWGIWVTDASYKLHYTKPVEMKNICADIDELKKTDREIMDKVDANLEKMYQALLEIQRGMKRSHKE